MNAQVDLQKLIEDGTQIDPRRVFSTKAPAWSNLWCGQRAASQPSIGRWNPNPRKRDSKWCKTVRCRLPRLEQTGANSFCGGAPSALEQRMPEWPSSAEDSLLKKLMQEVQKTARRKDGLGDIVKWTWHWESMRTDLTRRARIVVRALSHEKRMEPAWNWSLLCSLCCWLFSFWRPDGCLGECPMTFLEDWRSGVRWEQTTKSKVQHHDDKQATSIKSYKRQVTPFATCEVRGMCSTVTRSGQTASGSCGVMEGCTQCHVCEGTFGFLRKLGRVLGRCSQRKCSAWQWQRQWQHSLKMCQTTAGHLALWAWVMGSWPIGKTSEIWQRDERCWLKGTSSYTPRRQCVEMCGKITNWKNRIWQIQREICAKFTNTRGHWWCCCFGMSSLVEGRVGNLSSWCCAMLGSSIIDNMLRVLSFFLFTIHRHFSQQQAMLLFFWGHYFWVVWVSSSFTNSFKSSSHLLAGLPASLLSSCRDDKSCPSAALLVHLSGLWVAIRRACRRFRFLCVSTQFCVVVCQHFSSTSLALLFMCTQSNLRIPLLGLMCFLYHSRMRYCDLGNIHRVCCFSSFVSSLISSSWRSFPPQSFWFVFLSFLFVWMVRRSILRCVVRITLFVFLCCSPYVPSTIHCCRCDNSVKEVSERAWLSDVK